MSFAREALRKPRSISDLRGRPLSRTSPEAPPEPLPVLIGEQLRRYYASLLREPIPPHFVDLLRLMDASKGDS